MKTISIRLARGAVAVLAVSALTACVAPYQTTHRYPYQPAANSGRAMPGNYVEYGRVANIEVLRTQTYGAGPTFGGGALVGSLIGGVLGNQIGQGGGRAAATMLGIVGGSLIGDNIEAHAAPPRVSDSYRVSIQLDNGGYRVFDVPQLGDLRVGDRVQVNNGRIARV